MDSIVEPSRPRPARKVDRLPPHSPEAEQGVLGCVMLDPAECMGECIEAFKSEEVFYDLRHQVIYRALAQMFDGHEPIDIITLQQKLKDKNLLNEVGGIAYLSTLPDVVPSAANLSYYLGIVRDKYILRKAIHACTESVRRVYEFEGEVGELMDTIERDILAVSEIRSEGTEKTSREFALDAIDLIEFKFMNKDKIVGVPTGYADLDKKLGGLRNGEVTIIAGRPSTGKTSLAMCIAECAALEHKLPVGVFSFEMLGESLVERMIYSRTKIPARKVMGEGLNTGEFARISSAAGAIASSQLHIVDNPNLSVLELKAKARRLHRRHGIKLFVIDYLQLVGTTKKCSNREQEIADISRSIKKMALELNVPVILLAQLNREVEKAKRKPMLADLRESGSIEQDADTVLLLHPNAPAERDPNDNSPFEVLAIVAKQRNGPRGEVPLMFFPEFTRYESAARIAEADLPPGISSVVL